MTKLVAILATLTAASAAPAPHSPLMAEVVYILCMLTSLLCVILLGLGYRRTRARLLLWSSLCFVCLTFNNLLLFLDLVILPDVDLGLWRDWSALLAMAVLVFGLIWSAD